MNTHKKSFIAAAAALAIGTALFFAGNINSTAQSPAPSATTTTETTAKETPQVIHILVKNGYSPRLSYAAAGKPLRLDMETVGVYDCSSSIYIPALHYRKFLPATGVTSIDIPPQKKDSTLTVLCAMGMYSFDIEFN